MAFLFLSLDIVILLAVLVFLVQDFLVTFILNKLIIYYCKQYLIFLLLLMRDILYIYNYNKKLNQLYKQPIMLNIV